MERFLNRRVFLQLSGMTLAFTLADPLFARSLTNSRERLERLRQNRRRSYLQSNTPTLVVIFLRGGADGLNITVPTNPDDYPLYIGDYRPDIGVQMADIDAAGTRLTDVGGGDLLWALNPRMSALMPLWQDGALAVFPDVHYDNGSRSHFDSQQFYENGTPWVKVTPDGWANRFLTLSDTSGDPLLKAISFDTQTPFSLQGDYPTLTISNLADLSVSNDPGRNASYLDTQEIAYPLTENGPERYDLEVATAGNTLIQAIRAIQQQDPLPETDPTAPYPDDSYIQGRYTYFGNRLKDLAKLIKTDAFNIQLATVDLYGWDTHNLQLTAYHSHPNLSEALARGIAGFYQDLSYGDGGTDLGDMFRKNVVLAVFSEFGRTTRQNGSIGTDHGSATVSLVAGDASRVLGRRVIHGPAGWSGLDPSALRDGRDLKHSTDFRDVLGEILTRHMGFYDERIFPGFNPRPGGIGLIA